jgi:hypothetical protein
VISGSLFIIQKPVFDQLLLQFLRNSGGGIENAERSLHRREPASEDSAVDATDVPLSPEVIRLS